MTEFSEDYDSRLHLDDIRAIFRDNDIKFLRLQSLGGNYFKMYRFAMQDMNYEALSYVEDKYGITYLGTSCDGNDMYDLFRCFRVVYE